MINFDEYTNENKLKHNPNWPYIPDHPYRILIIGGSESGKTNALFNLINNQPDIDKIYFYAKDLYKPKYQFLINKRESAGLMQLMILKLSLSIQVVCRMFIKILLITILINKRKY